MVAGGSGGRGYGKGGGWHVGTGGGGGERKALLGYLGLVIISRNRAYHYILSFVLFFSSLLSNPPFL